MLNRLSMDLWLQISVRLDPRSMKSLWTASRYYYFDVINSHPNFWKLLVISKLGMGYPNPDLPDEFWKDLFYRLNRESDTIFFSPEFSLSFWDPTNWRRNTDDGMLSRFCIVWLQNPVAVVASPVAGTIHPRQMLESPNLMSPAPILRQGLHVVGESTYLHFRHSDVWSLNHGPVDDLQNYLQHHWLTETRNLHNPGVSVNVMCPEQVAGDDRQIHTAACEAVISPPGSLFTFPTFPLGPGTMRITYCCGHYFNGSFGSMTIAIYPAHQEPIQPPIPAASSLGVVLLMDYYYY